MATCSIHHLALTSASFDRAKRFYGELLALLGYEVHINDIDIAAWVGPEPEILLYPARTEQTSQTHRTYDPGIHHVAFFAASREIVDAAHSIAVTYGVQVLDEPKCFVQYRADYYATFFHDLDGIKLEFVNLDTQVEDR